MLTICVMLISFGYNTFLFMLFFIKTLERRYSLHATFWGTIACWTGICLIKVPVFVSIGIKYTMLLNIVVILLILMYQLIFFQAALVRRALSFVLFCVYMYFMELVAVRAAYLIVGESRMMQLDSNFTLISLIIIDILLVFGFYPLLCLWNLLLKIGWKSTGGGQQWLCVLLPLSQYFYMEYLAITYNIQQEAIPILAICGLLLGIAGDFYMFVLFNRENKKRKAEESLLQEQQLYERERLYYEHLKESQKEIARVWHDYQNYILVLHNISKKKQAEGYEG